MKKIIFFVLILISFKGFSQSTVLLRGDTIKVYKQGDTATLKVEGEVMITHYKLGSTTDSVLRWNPVTKKITMSDASGIGGGDNIYNSNGILEGNRTLTGLNNTYYLRFDSLLTFRAGRNGVNRFSFDATTSSMVSQNTNSAFTANPSNAIINYTGNSIRVFADSSTSTKLIAYETNINGSLTTNALTSKQYVDSVVAGAGSNLIFEESVIESNDSVFLRNEKIEPATDPSAYGYADGTYGYKPTIKLNESNLGDNYLIKYNSDASEYQTFNPNIMLGRIEFSMHEDVWLDLGDSSIIDSNFIDRAIYALQVDGEWLTALPGLTYYEHNSATGELVIHPAPTSDSTKISIYTVWTPMFSTLTRNSAPAPIVWTEINYETQTNLTESPDKTWYASTGGGWGNTGLNDAYKIPASGEAAYRIQRTSASQWYCAIGIDVTDNQEGFSGFTRGAIAVDLGGGVFNIYRTSGASSFDTGVTLAIGDYMALWRYADGTVTIRKSVDGVNWTDVYAYGATSTADMFFKCDLNYTGGGTLYGIMFNPQVYGQTNQ